MYNTHPHTHTPTHKACNPCSTHTHSHAGLYCTACMQQYTTDRHTCSTTTYIHTYRQTDRQRSATRTSCPKPTYTVLHACSSIRPTCIHTYIHTCIHTYIHTYKQTDRQTDRRDRNLQVMQHCKWTHAHVRASVSYTHLTLPTKA